MVESAAHLVDYVFPEAPVRQWVLTFPFPLRFLLAANPKALTDVLAVVQRCLSTFLIRRAGFTVASGARTGAVTLIQRFGSALNLNPHLHMLFLDGAYRFGNRKAHFHRARRATHDQLVQLLDTLSRRIVRVLERRGLLIADPVDPNLEFEIGSSLDQIQAASADLDMIGMLAGRMGDNVMMGWVAHFVIGAVIYGLAYANLRDVLPGEGDLVKGIVLGVVGWLIMMVVMMPMMGAGLFAMNMGMMATVATLVLHVIFGLVLGLSYARVGGGTSAAPAAG